MVSKISASAQKRDLGAVLLGGRALEEVGLRDAAVVLLRPDEAVGLDLDLDLARQRVDDGDADAVQTAGDRVAAAAELAAGVQDGEDDLDGRPALALDDADGDAAAVVLDPDPAVGEQRDVDAVAVAGEGLVDRVVDDLVDQVVQAALTGGADVHARALADGVEALEDGDGTGVVGHGLRALRSDVRLDSGRTTSAVEPDSRPPSYRSEPTGTALEAAWRPFSCPDVPVA